jgi:hypothetical protein
MTPLLWLAVSAAGDRRVVDSAVPPVVMIGDIPSYVFDKHTAAGKAAIHRFARENAAVRDALAAFVPEYRAEGGNLGGRPIRNHLTFFRQNLPTYSVVAPPPP